MGSRHNTKVSPQDRQDNSRPQVRVKWVQECSPIPERVFKSAIGKNYFNVNKFMHELDKQQVDDLLHLMLGRKSGREPPQPDRTTFQREQHNGTGRIHQGRGVARAMEPQQANEPPRGAWGRPPPSVTTMQGGSSSFSQSTGWDYHQKPTQQSPPPFTPSGRNIPDSEIKPAGWGSPPKGKPQSSSAPASQSGMNDSDFVVVPTGWGSPPKSRSQSPPYDQDQRNQSNRLAGLKEKEKLGWEDRSNGWNAREPCYAAKPRPRIQEAFGEWKGNGRSESVKVKVEPSESSCPCQSHRSFDSSSTGSGGSSGNRGKREGKQKGKGFVKEEFPQGGWKDHTQRQTDNRQLALDEETAKVFERLAVADQPLADALQNVLELSKTSVQQALHEAAEARQALETEWKGKVQSIDAEWNEKIRKMDLERLRMEINWAEMLPKVASAYNNSVHLSTCRTPNELHKSFRRRRPFEGLNRDQIHRLPPNTREFAIQHEKELATIVENLRKALHRMIEQANKHCRPLQFQIGDLVWVKAKEFAPEENILQKLLPAYRGSWLVLEVKGEEDGPSYTIEIPVHLHAYPVFQASKLLSCVTSQQFPSRRSMISPDMDGSYDIEGIVDEDVFRTGGRGRPQKQYKVRFAYQESEDDRWFTRRELLETTPDIVRAYERDKKGKGPALD
ncbi:hypothetical protein CBR_g40534 [Chara braunii]|uniref:DCD domain-containing protein n=1 Tax=Chara braunii TaxID=69332 RepID=A0A388K245_CHABU|nr:hypothetical protein CBR_g40534 [Chara braunii]|eukprot:GBG64085.1 hypothetical protein CBR_g40534 [Chara braunii]